MMSLRNEVDALENQLADLHMNNDGKNSSPSRIKKIPPAVPPKKKNHNVQTINDLRDSSGYSNITPKSPNLLNDNVKRYHNMNHEDVGTYCQDYAGSSNCSKQSLPITSKTYASSAYSNIPSYGNSANEFPPIPPPPPFHITTSKFTMEANQNVDDYLPPPSPVSSNYSELVRATTNIIQETNYPPIYQNDFPDYRRPPTSTYESIYEPIEPRQPYYPVENNNAYQNNQNNHRDLACSSKTLPNEAEVDALTDLLVKSISDNQDLAFYGICVKCNKKVMGENSGCTAMGNTYHVKCFTCHCCDVNLHGKRLYAVEGKPYCEADYYETLEKCYVCNQPILDRILRATGNPYHKKCFTCIACGKSLDGIPFTVDAMNHIHCIEDFHKKFAPRCCVCELPIMPEEGEEETVRVVALDRSFHVLCYRCEDCGLLLSSEAEGRGCYPLDDHILCKNCNAQRIRMITNVMTTDL